MMVRSYLLFALVCTSLGAGNASEAGKCPSGDASGKCKGGLGDEEVLLQSVMVHEKQADSQEGEMQTKEKEKNVQLKKELEREKEEETQSEKFQEREVQSLRAKIEELEDEDTETANIALTEDGGRQKQAPVWPKTVAGKYCRSARLQRWTDSTGPQDCQSKCLATVGCIGISYSLTAYTNLCYPCLDDVLTVDYHGFGFYRRPQASETKVSLGCSDTGVSRFCAYYKSRREFCNMGKSGTVRRRGWGGDAKDNCAKTCGYCSETPKAACSPTKCSSRVFQCKEQARVEARAASRPRYADHFLLGCEIFAYGYPEGLNLPLHRRTALKANTVDVAPRSYQCCSLAECKETCNHSGRNKQYQDACKSGCAWMDSRHDSSCCTCTDKAVRFESRARHGVNSGSLQVWSQGDWKSVPDTCTGTGNTKVCTVTGNLNVCTEGFLYIKNLVTGEFVFSATVDGEDIGEHRLRTTERYSIAKKSFTECMAEKHCYDKIKAKIQTGKADTFVKDCLLCNPDHHSNSLCSKYRTCIRKNRATLSDKSNLLLKNIDIATEQIDTTTAVLPEEAPVSGSGATCTDPRDNAFVAKLKSDCGCLTEFHDVCDGAEDQLVCLKQIACESPQVCDSWKKATKGGKKNCPSSFVEQASDSNLSVLDETLTDKRTCR